MEDALKDCRIKTFLYGFGSGIVGAFALYLFQMAVRYETVANLIVDLSNSETTN